MRDEAEPELIERARQDRAAFAVLYDRYVTRIYAFCAVHSATREEAEDLTALTFERALAAIARHEERGQIFSGWLLRIAANAANQARRPTAVPLGDVESIWGSAGAVTSQGQADAESWVAEWEQADWLEELLTGLPPDGQRVVHLRFFEDRPFQEVAAAMGRSEGAVKHLLRRTLIALRQRLQEEEQDDGCARE